jgi:Chromate transporter
LKVGAFTIGGGFTMIAFIQDQVVGQFGWLTPREFIDGLALGQLTPGPLLMIAAYVGYKVAGVAGAAVAATASFLPSFVIMLAVLPVLDRVRKLAWVKAVMKSMAPAVIGILAVSLVRLAPSRAPRPSRDRHLGGDRHRAAEIPRRCFQAHACGCGPWHRAESPARHSRLQDRRTDHRVDDRLTFKRWTVMA